MLVHGNDAVDFSNGRFQSKCSGKLHQKQFRFRGPLFTPPRGSSRAADSYCCPEADSLRVSVQQSPFSELNIPFYFFLFCWSCSAPYFLKYIPLTLSLARRPLRSKVRLASPFRRTSPVRGM